MARRIAGDLLILIVTAFTVYLSVIMTRRIQAVVLKDTYIEIFRYELVICAVFLILALDVRFGLFTLWRPAVLRWIGWILRVVVAFPGTVILFFCGKVIRGSMISNAGPADHAIVLGLALENGKPSPDLLARLDAAQGYLEKYPRARLVLTGGNADEPGRTEADVMHDLLAGRGVPEDRLLLEDRAQTTKENFSNIAKMISLEKPVVMISSDYHMDRAVRNAAEAGFSGVMRFPAPSRFFAFGANMLWEVVLDLNDLIKK